jgi:PadR family transcriptional regulator, regulatory protein PadR
VNSDIPRLSSTEHLILDLLAGEEMFGLQLVEESGGALKRGTVYVTLGRMQDKGYVESWTEPHAPGAIGLPRRLYRPTALGLRLLEAWAAAARTLNRRPRLQHA